MTSTVETLENERKESNLVSSEEVCYRCMVCDKKYSLEEIIDTSSDDAQTDNTISSSDDEDIVLKLMERTCIVQDDSDSNLNTIEETTSMTGDQNDEITSFIEQINETVIEDNKIKQTSSEDDQINSNQEKLFFKTNEISENIPTPKFADTIIGGEDIPSQALNQNFKSEKSKNCKTKPKIKIRLKNIIDLNGGEAYQCTLCDKISKKRVALTNHFRTHLQPKTFNEIYTCKICNKTFKRLSNARMHEQIHIGKMFTCHLCGKSFTRNFTLKAHMRSHTKECPYKCSFCDRAFTQQIGWKVHERTHTKERPYTCNLCNKTFMTSCSLQEHTRIHTGEKPHKCQICNKKFTALSTLRSHERTHSGEKPFQCDICSKTYVTKRLVIIHKRLHTSETPYQCRLCDKAFISNIKLKAHIDVEHTKYETGGKYQCVTCLDYFSKLSELKLHKTKIHSIKKSETEQNIWTKNFFPCEICGSEFKYQSGLKRHYEIHHSSEKTHKCKYCPKAFAISTGLVVHERIHTGYKPFKCAICEHAFTTSGNLKAHKRIHTGEKPFLCDICNKIFRSKISLMKHKEEMHNDEFRNNT